MHSRTRLHCQLQRLSRRHGSSCSLMVLVFHKLLGQLYPKVLMKYSAHPLTHLPRNSQRPSACSPFQIYLRSNLRKSIWESQLMYLWSMTVFPTAPSPTITSLTWSLELLPEFSIILILELNKNLYFYIICI